MAALRVQVERNESDENSKVCIICGTGEGKLTSGSQGRQKIRDAASQRNDSVFEQLKKVNGDEFFYHLSNHCYRRYTLPDNIRRAIDRISQNSRDLDDNGNPSESNDEQTPVRVTRSKQILNVKSFCIICNKERYKGIKDTSQLSEEARTNEFLKMAKQFDDHVHTRLCQFPTTDDILNAGIRYHRNCMRLYEKKYQREYGGQTNSISATLSRTADSDNCNDDAGNDYEYEDNNSEPNHDYNSDYNNNNPSTDGEAFIKPRLSHYNSSLRKTAVTEWLLVGMPRLEAGEAFTLTEICTCVNELLPIDSSLRNDDVKRYLIELAGADLQFSVSRIPRVPTLVFHAKITTADVVDVLRRRNSIKECAEALQSSMASVSFNLEDKFCDAVDLERAYDDVHIPDQMQEFFMTLFSLKANEFNDDSSSSDSERGSGTNSRMLQLKMLYQVIYYIKNRGMKKTPLHVMLGLTVHHASRNSALIKSLNHLGLCISYDSVQRIKTRLAEYAIETCAKNVPLPSHFDKENFTVVAFDNIDHKDTGNTGMHSTHDTACIVVQKEPEVIHSKPSLSETSIKSRARMITSELPCQQLINFEKPSKDIPFPSNYPPTQCSPSVTPDMYDGIRSEDLAWFLSRGNFVEKLEDWVASNQHQKVPSWPAFNSVLQEDPRTKDIIGFLPVLPHPVTEYQTVYTALLNFKDVLSQLHQSKLAVFCDEGVYHIARHIQFLHAEEFKDIVLMLGTFHLIKVMLTCVGKYLKGSGVEDLLRETETTGVSTTDQVLSGTNYARSLYAFNLLEEAVQRLQIEAFLDETGVDKYTDELSLISDLRDALGEGAIDEARVMLNNFEGISINLKNDLCSFIKKRCDDSELFKFWDTFLILMRVTKDLIRADRTGDWLLHVDSVKKSLPIFHIMDRTNYARWAAVYLHDILSLETEAPEIFTQFLRGRFCVKQSNSCFTSVGTDQALEQTINRSCKSNSGIVGQARQEISVASWCLTFHEMLGISNTFRRITHVKNDNYELTTHREYSPTHTKVSEQQVAKIITYILEHVNPFSTGKQPLRNITTEVTLAPAATTKLLTVISDGCILFDQFCLDRFVTKKILISDSIKKINLPTFDDPKDNLTNQTRLIKLAERRNYDTKELFSYELMKTNSLFEGNQTLKKEKNLKSILEQLEKSMESIPCDVTPSAHNMCHLVDVMTICRTINMRRLKTFGDYAVKFCESVSKLMGQLGHRVDFIFESFDNQFMLEEGVTSAPYHNIHEGITIPKDPKQFWASKHNKVLIQKFLRDYILKYGHEKWSTREILLSTTTSTPCLSVQRQPLQDAELLQKDNPIHGTVIKIIHHLDHAVRRGHQRVMIVSDDVAVAVIALYHWQTHNINGLQELWLSGVGTKQYPIHALAMHHGPARCKVLPALYYLTGSEVTSKVNTKLAALRAKPEDYLMDFARGTSPDDIASSVENAEKYLVKVVQISSEATTFNELRYLLYHHGKTIAVTDLPPTSATMNFHILRAFYFTHAQITCLNENPIRLNPCNFGYEERDNGLSPKTVTDLYPSIRDLVPNCTDVRCKRGGCHCASAQSPCIAFCKCQINGTCQNPFNK